MMIMISVIMALNRQYISSRAAETSVGYGTFSNENSYVFASPVSAVGDGISIIRITVVVLNNQGLGVENQIVQLKEENGLRIETILGKTDAFGRAIFDVTSNSPGSYKIGAVVSDTPLSSQVSVSFR